MELYPINELERLTGIKAHTIRIWEKRYGLITPDRTETNRRLYSDDHVRKLLNVTTLMSQGFKISKIASLSEEELHEQIQVLSINESEDSVTAGFINDLVRSMLDFNEAGFEKIFSAAIIRLGVYETMLQIIYPFLNKVGVLWSVDKTAPVQEHFATSIIRRKLMAAIDGLLPGMKSRKFLLFLPEGEWHEIGLLFANYLIRRSGFEALYIGQNVPMKDIEKLATVLRPDYMLTFYIASRPTEEIELQLNSLVANNPFSVVLVAGNHDLINKVKTRVRNIAYLPEVKSLIEYLN